MKPVWQPLIPMRFVVRDGKNILQQAWGEHAYGDDYKWNPTGDYMWKDVPLMSEFDDNPHFWTKEDMKFQQNRRESADYQKRT